VEYDLSHEFDYINWIFGNFKLIKKINNKISNLKINSNDHLIYIGKFKKNSYLNITLNYFSKISMRFLIIEMKEMTMKVDLIKRKIISKKTKSKNISTIKFSNKTNLSYEVMHKSIINKKYDNLCSYKNALKVLSFT
jgi:CMP-N,N'-diacetyllegionaminic acid synthase